MAPAVLTHRLIDHAEDVHSVRPGIVRKMLGNAFMSVRKVLQEGSLPLLLGGDHTVAIGSVFAANEQCRMNNERLGVLWFDAHADFNTIETSETKNIHGMPVAVLCGHTLPLLSFGEFLHPDQFAFVGVRDIDDEEYERFQKYKMKTIGTVSALESWMDSFDKIHVSFDTDCFDTTVTTSTNTPVKNGLRLCEVESYLECIRKSNKLLSADIVEFNPMFDSGNATLDILVSVVRRLLGFSN